jgi:hypothetical protein
MESKTIELFGPQFAGFNFKTQFGAAIAGVQSGKTFLGSVWAGKKIQEFPKGVGIIGAPTYKILQQSTLPKFFQNFPELRRYFKESKGIIELPTGGTVYYRCEREQVFDLDGAFVVVCPYVCGSDGDRQRDFNRQRIIRADQ